MPRDYRLYLEDIVKAIDNIEKYTDGISYSDLNENRMILEAALFNYR